MPSLLKRVAMAATAAHAPFPEAALDRFVELNRLKRLLEALHVNCVLDVGANRGQFAEEVRGIGYRGRIASFEPLQQEFAQLTRRFRHDDQWRGFPFALGTAPSRTTINVVPGLTVLSSLLKPRRAAPGMHTQPVEVRRLDAVLQSATDGVQRPRVLLKMDTQGYDLNVFEGSRGCLDHIVALQSELSVAPLYEGMPHYLDALRAYEQAGFSLYHLALVTRTLEGGIQELNCLMKKEGTDARLDSRSVQPRFSTRRSPA
jgi:FkbM family methyltransferase